jgi:hypothetical protein
MPLPQIQPFLILLQRASIDTQIPCLILYPAFFSRPPCSNLLPFLFLGWRRDSGKFRAPSEVKTSHPANGAEIPVYLLLETCIIQQTSCAELQTYCASAHGSFSFIIIIIIIIININLRIPSPLFSGFSFREWAKNKE